MTPATRQAFSTAAKRVTAAYHKGGGFPGQEVTPPLLHEAIVQCLDICADPEGAGELSPADVNELGTHALNCVADLALWAEHLKLEPERAAIEDLAIEFARWVGALSGEITVLEPVVNALARRANAAHDPAALVPLCVLAREITRSVAQSARMDTGTADPWRILNFNYAIVATRTQHPDLMAEAYDTLEANLPDACPGFFAEGVRESQKAVYGEAVRAALRDRQAKWTVKH